MALIEVACDISQPGTVVCHYAQRYPEVRVDIVSESRMIDIVAEGYDAGSCLTESVPQDMIAVPLSRDIRMLVVATPEYFSRHGLPEHPNDLLNHRRVGMWMSHGGIYHWELEYNNQSDRWMSLSILPSMRGWLSNGHASRARRWLYFGMVY